MKDYKDILSEALSEIKEKELEGIPDENAIKHKFSEKFKRKSKKLIKEQKKYEKNSFAKTIRKIAAVIIATVLAFAIMNKADAFPDKVLDFLYYVYEKYIVVSYDANVSHSDTELITYTLKNIPENYVLRQHYDFGFKIRQIWENEDTGATIMFRQTKNDTSGSVEINANKSTIEEFEVGDIGVILIRFNNKIVCYWSEKNCYFELSYSEHLGKEFAVSNIGKLVEK